MNILRRTVLLFGIQAINLLGPLLAIPLILRNSPIDVYSQYSAWITFSQFSIIVLDLGYSIFGAKACSKTDNPDNITETISTSIICKIFASILVFVAAFIFAEKNSFSQSIPILITLYILSTSILPIFYFVSTGKMKRYFFGILLSKFFFLMIVYLSKTISVEFIIATLMCSSIIILLTTISTWKIFISPSALRFSNIKQSVPFMSSRVGVAVLMQGSVLLIYNEVTVQQFAYIAFADQLYRLAISATAPVTQVLLPAMASGLQVKKYFTISSFLFFILITAVSIILLHLRSILETIGFDTFTSEFESVVFVYYIYGILTLINFLSRTFGYPIYIKMEAVKHINQINFVALFFFISSIVLLNYFQTINVMTIITTFLISEIIILTLRITLYLKVGKHVF